MLLSVAVDNLTLYVPEYHDPTHDRQQTTGTGTVYRFEELRPVQLCCSSRGGNPAPLLRIYLGDNELTNDFIVHTEEVCTVLRGLEMTSYDVTLVNYEFKARADQRGLSLQCVAVIKGHDELTRRVSGLVDVKCKYLCLQ